MNKFDVSVNRVLGHEGGYVNHPNDPGGETNWGISKRAYPRVDIKNLTRQGAIEIYRRDYWNTIHGDDLPDAVAFQVFDAAVNHGVRPAVMWMQQAVGTVADGIIGPMTLAAIKRADPLDFLCRFVAIRLNFYTELRTWKTFGRGWTKRMVNNLLFAAEDN